MIRDAIFSSCDAHEMLYIHLVQRNFAGFLFILSLDKKMRAKVAWTIALLEAGGNSLREPYSKHLDDGILELRVKVGSDISKVLYFFIVGKRVILTHGFVKKTDDTPLLK